MRSAKRMPRWFAVVIVSLFILASAGCAQSGSNGTGAAKEIDVGTWSSAEVRVLMHMRTRDTLLTISSTREGLRYTVEGEDGHPLARDLTESMLQARFPGVYDIYRGAIGRTPASHGIWDASLHGSRPPSGAVPTLGTPQEVEPCNPILYER